MPKIPHKKIFIIAGELSGDLLAAQLVTSLQRQLPSLKFSGVGGLQMQQAGVNLLVNMNQLAIVGAWEALTHLKQLRSIQQMIKKNLSENVPDLIVLIDYPGFNLRMAQFAKTLNIRVIYYVSPQIWAWHRKRIFKIKRCVDHMMVLFDFETKIYQQHHIPVTFVGHPLLDQFKTDQSLKVESTSIIQNRTLPINHSGIVKIALLPGSRPNEIKRLLPKMIAASKLLRNRFPNIHFVLPLANSLDKKMVKAQCPDDFEIVAPPLVKVLPFCQAAIVTSGTATLEVALCQTPMVIVYKTNWLTYWLARWLIKINKIGLINIIADKFISKELIQQEATAKAMADEVSLILTDLNYRQNMISNFIALRKKLGEPGANERAAQVVLKMLY